MGVKVGIDLGTTFSAVAWRNPRTKVIEVVRSDRESDKLITPSAVQVFEDGSYVCGAVAKEAFEDAEEGVATAFKRAMGTDGYLVMMPDGKEYNAEQLSAMLLRHLKTCAERSMGDTIDEAVITVPAYFEDGPRQATRRAAQAAGLKVHDIISEPTAAALNYGLRHWRENAKILVYDLGGGTFDVTLVGMQKGNNLCTIGTIGEHKRGGRDWDERLTELVISKFIQETGCDREDLDINEIRGLAEQWKIAMTQKASISIRLRVNGYGFAEVEVTRKEFDRETRDLLELTGNLCDHLLADLKLQWQQITDVLLVGGSTRMPQVSEYLTTKLGKPPIAHVNPDQAVALGAAMRANMGVQQTGVEVEIIAGKNQSEELLMTLKNPVKDSRPIELEDLSFQDAVAHPLGIILADVNKLEYVNRTIIPVYSMVPCKFAVAAKHGGEEMEIYVVQGSGPIAECTVNRKYVVSGITPPRGQLQLIRVQYSYDRNHMIHVQARQGSERVDLPIREEAFTDADLHRFMMPIDPEELEPDQCIVLALDVSGSMSGDPMRSAQREMANFVRKDGGKSRFGVIAVSDRAQWVVKPTKDVSVVLSGIDSMTCGMTGYCNEADPFSAVLEYMQPGEQRTAIVLADGIWEHQTEAVSNAKACHRAGIHIIGMGFGSADREFLRDISSDPNMAQYSSSYTGLGASFGKIAQTLGSGGSGMSQQGGGLLSSLFRKKGGDSDQCETWETNND